MGEDFAIRMMLRLYASQTARRKLLNAHPERDWKRYTFDNIEILEMLK